MSRRVHFIAAVWIVTSLCCASSEFHPNAEELAGLKRQGNLLIQGIEAFKAKHGCYPDSLSEAALTQKDVGYGGFRYSKEKNWYTLGLGTYETNRFYLYYISSVGEWGFEQD